MARRRIPAEAGAAAVRAWSQARGQQADAQQPPIDRNTLATAVRYLLEELAERAPGNSAEVRVPPFGVTQCIAGPTHTRGTPPNVIELDAETWLELATGRTSWGEAKRSGRIHASGTRADLSGCLPL